MMLSLYRNVISDPLLDEKYKAVSRLENETKSIAVMLFDQRKFIDKRISTHIPLNS